MAKAERHQLWSALDHAALVSRGAANYSGYCLLQGHWLVGYDGTVAAGSRVEEELSVAPDTDLFRAAIARVGTPIQSYAYAGHNTCCEGQCSSGIHSHVSALVYSKCCRRQSANSVRRRATSRNRSGIKDSNKQIRYHC